MISRGGEIKVADNAQRIVPGPDGVVTLPPGVNLNNVQVVGRDLVVTLPDGSADHHRRRRGVRAAAGARRSRGPRDQPCRADDRHRSPRTAAGPPQSSGGNFDVAVPPLDPGVPLGDLIPPTELVFTPIRSSKRSASSSIASPKPAGRGPARRRRSGGRQSRRRRRRSRRRCRRRLPARRGRRRFAGVGLAEQRRSLPASAIRGPGGSILVQQVQGASRSGPDDHGRCRPPAHIP